jgi:hypothetical protein
MCANYAHLPFDFVSQCSVGPQQVFEQREKLELELALRDLHQSLAPCPGAYSLSPSAVDAIAVNSIGSNARNYLNEETTEALSESLRPTSRMILSRLFTLSIYGIHAIPHMNIFTLMVCERSASSDTYLGSLLLHARLPLRARQP